MDEETERLRDIFVETTGTDSVTESQDADRGTLLAAGEVDGPEDVVARMRDRLRFRTDLDDDALAAVVEGFYDGAGDADLAADLGVDEATVRRARLDLHLLRDDDADPEALAAVRADGEPDGVDPEALARAEAVAAATERARRVSERYRTAFAALCTDRDLTGRVVGDARADGLREAAADIEPDVDLDI